MSSAPDHPDLRVHRRWGATKPRKMVRVSGVSPPVDLIGFNNTINTLERAVKERVFYVKDRSGAFVEPPRPVGQHFSTVMSSVLGQLSKFLPRTAPLSRREFVDSFRGRKRKIYAAASEDLLRKDFSPKDAEVKVFVKYEKTDKTRKTDPVPRVISPRSPRYNVEVGRFLRPLEERVFRAIGKMFGHPTVIKGMNSQRSGTVLREKWEKFGRPVAIGLDASRFDQHVSVDALCFEHDVYNRCFPRRRHRDRLSYLLRMQLRNVCRGYTADGKLRYTTNGVRMSGDMNTSLGNCILVCCMIRAYALDRGVNLQLANNGDDCVVFMEQRDQAKFMDGLDGWFLRMGFNMAVEDPCYQFEEVEFCQTHPVCVGGNNFIMVRHPKWAVAKDTCCVHNYITPKSFKGWLHAVGTGGMAMTGGIPVFQEFYSAYLRAGEFNPNIESGLSWGVRTLAKDMTRGYCEVLPEVRASFYWAFGVTPDEQLVIEDFYRGVEIGCLPVGQLTYQSPLPL